VSPVGEEHGYERPEKPAEAGSQSAKLKAMDSGEHSGKDIADE